MMAMPTWLNSPSSLRKAHLLILISQDHPVFAIHLPGRSYQWVHRAQLKRERVKNHYLLQLKQRTYNSRGKRKCMFFQKRVGTCNKRIFTAIRSLSSDSEETTLLKEIWKCRGKVNISKFQNMLKHWNIFFENTLAIIVMSKVSYWWRMQLN